MGKIKENHPQARKIEIETIKEFVKEILYIYITHTTPFFLSAARHWLRARVLYVSETPLREEGPPLRLYEL